MIKRFYLLIFLLLSLEASSQVDSLYYHNYNFESQYGASGAYPSTDYMQMITRFTPALYPAQLMGVQVWFRNAASPAPFKIIVREDSASTTDANNSGLVYISPQAIANPSSSGAVDSAYSEYIDLSAENLFFTSGDAYAGVTQNLQVNGFVGFALDTNYLALNDRHWISTSQGAAGSWMQFLNWSFIPAQYAITAYFHYLQDGVDAIPDLKKSILYPNPAKDFFNVSVSTPSRCAIFIFDMAGKLQKKFLNVNPAAGSEVSDLEPGIYLVELQCETSVIYSRLIKE